MADVKKKEFGPEEKRPNFSTSYIENGSVLDHIPSGDGITVLQVLGIDLSNLEHTVMLFGHVKTKKARTEEHGYKDKIKLLNYFVTENQYKELTEFAPTITLSIIKGFQVREKYTIQNQGSD